jgi:DNA-binding transcriptional MerR regulator
VYSQSVQALSIGAVLEQLRAEFPDVTVSKIRFLEAEGLISPHRSPSGYRRFTPADCERLRYVLTAQRDRYLPLKVIKEQLDAMDADGSPPSGSRSLAVVRGRVQADDLRLDPPVRLTQADLLERSGVEERLLAQLISAGLVQPGPGGYFPGDAVAVCANARAVCELGLEVRHLRAFKVAADREVALAAQIAAPIAKGHGIDGPDRARELAREFGARALTLHASLVKAAVRTALEP